MARSTCSQVSTVCLLYTSIDAHIILGKSIKKIAEAEGVHEESVRQSIKRGLERMKKTF